MPDPYSQLLEWRRAEGAGRGLAKLPKDFYETTRRYLAEVRHTYETELRENPSSKKGELARQTHQRATQVARDVVEGRMTKVLSQAFQAAVGGSREVPNALSEERTLFDRAVALLRAHRTGVSPYLDTGAPFVGEAPPPEQPPQSPAPSPPASPRSPPSSPAEPSRTPGSAYVRILRDTPPIESGGETLDLRKEDVLSLPEETARLLVAGKVAEPIRAGDRPTVT